MRKRFAGLAALGVASLLLSGTQVARATEDEKGEVPGLAATPAAVDPSAPPPVSGLPPVDRPLPPRLSIDPIFDITLMSMAVGSSALTEVILSTGEIRPQRPGDRSKLLGIDRGAVSQNFDSNARTYSNVGLFLAVGYAALEPVVTGLRDGAPSGLVDGVLFGESLSLAWAFTGITKLAVRRPRPSAYQEQARLDAEFGADKSPSVSDTDSSLSFFSTHAAIVAATTGTATYLAFLRSRNSVRPWLTLGLGLALTTAVSVERVRAGAHFPTDVVAGALAGGSIGVLVPHLHRIDREKHALTVGSGPPGAPAGLSLSGLF